MAALAGDTGYARYAGRTLTIAELARVHALTDVDGSRPDCWRHVTEVGAYGLSARPAAYR